MKVLVNYACFHRRNDVKRNSYLGNKTLNGHYLNNCISVHPKLAALCLLNLKVLPNKKKLCVFIEENKIHIQCHLTD